MKATCFRALSVPLLAVLISALLLGCSVEPAPPEQEAIGPAVAAAATSAPAPDATSASVNTVPPAVPTSVASPPVGQALPTPESTPEKLPYWVTHAFSDIYSDVEGFQGVLTLTIYTDSSSPTTMTLREWFHRPNLTKLEVLRSTGGQAPPGTILIYDGKVMTIFDPSNDQMVQITDPTQLDLFLQLPGERFYPMLQLFQINQAWSGLASQSTIAVGPHEKVAERDTIRVDLTAEASMPHFRNLSLWMDKVTNVPLRARAEDLDGSQLLAIEFSQYIPTTWDPQTVVGPEVFSFTPPTRTGIITATPEALAEFAGFRSLPSTAGQSEVGFAILQPMEPIESTRGRSVWLGSIGGSKLVVLMYGNRQEATTVVVQRLSTLQLPALSGAAPSPVSDLPGELYQAGSVTVVNWTRGTSSLTLATALPSDQALEMARSVK